MHTHKRSQLSSSAGFMDSIAGTDLPANQNDDIDKSSVISSVRLAQDEETEEESAKQPQPSKLFEVINLAADYDTEEKKEMDAKTKMQRQTSILSGLQRGI